MGNGLAPLDWEIFLGILWLSWLVVILVVVDSPFVILDWYNHQTRTNQWTEWTRVSITVKVCFNVSNYQSLSQCIKLSRFVPMEAWLSSCWLLELIVFDQRDKCHIDCKSKVTSWSLEPLTCSCQQVLDDTGNNTCSCHDWYKRSQVEEQHKMEGEW